MNTLHLPVIIEIDEDGCFIASCPSFKGRELVKILESIGFKVTRTKGSHVRLRSEDGRVTTVPVHTGKNHTKRISAKDNQRRAGVMSKMGKMNPPLLGIVIPSIQTFLPTGSPETTRLKS